MEWVAQRKGELLTDQVDIAACTAQFGGRWESGESMTDEMDAALARGAAVYTMWETEVPSQG